ncbi:phosphomannose isomerase type II C-terminal cupin domain [Synechococcus elongatus]|uniref:Mannose-1-phosphate guanylyltransferase-like n=3 Tax=Synechococcus elongatus TaxID=32046 RepID=Q31PV1_SYNE7|nr:phosphomannose isomerase type II C-terminal cupin domain [Synechococcus elongatus]ABB56918.1 mannose-1-phosphate guanylyltransferase-like [Synechococcus elongatus PCC 7942 = FACHB-805]AJD58554.1 mannose-6-phosphate isomerase [Synechococcus elongatus UTEX 2973]MBD2588793.1 phosphomannose isomerase type II C-terminal cupin domain [Synechococcus elongatus FACHB-242]MBD2689619.1 phosphomannose isomerase type II C-terminal cupin domain [Synechococcus elongatus FACHB-1061]MBD2708225.1 phosphomann
MKVGDRDQRPWGQFEILAQGSGYQVKRLEVLPGQQLSLQRHQQRQEHWLVVQGLARVQLGDRQFSLRVGQSLDIAIGEWHRLQNPGDELLALIEVQMGAYLGEDDIERRADDYGRCPTS